MFFPSWDLVGAAEVCGAGVCFAEVCGAAVCGAGVRCAEVCGATTVRVGDGDGDDGEGGDGDGDDGEGGEGEGDDGEGVDGEGVDGGGANPTSGIFKSILMKFLAFSSMLLIQLQRHEFSSSAGSWSNWIGHRQRRHGSCLEIGLHWFIHWTRHPQHVRSHGHVLPRVIPWIRLPSSQSVPHRAPYACLHWRTHRSGALRSPSCQHPPEDHHLDGFLRLHNHDS